MANNVALSKLYKSGEPETPPEDYLPSFVALLKKAVGKDGRTAATIVHRTLMKKKFRLTQPVAEYINQQDGPEQKEDLALAYQLCCTLKLLDDDDLDALAGRGGADLVLEALSVAHSAVGSEARSLERLCSAAAQNGAFQGLQLPEKDFAYKLLATTRALIHHGNLRQAEEQLAPHAPSNSRSRTPSVPVASPRRHRSRSRSPDARPAKNSKLTPEAFWGPQNSALFPTDDRSARDLPTTAGDHIRDSETQKRIAEGRLVTAQLVMRLRQRLQNAQVRHDSTHDGEMIVSSNTVKSTTGKLTDAIPLLIAILKLMAACFTGPGGADPGETIGYAAFIENLVLVFHPIVILIHDRSLPCLAVQSATSASSSEGHLAADCGLAALAPGIHAKRLLQPVPRNLVRPLQLPAHRDHLVRRPQRSRKPKRSRYCLLLSVEQRSKMQIRGRVPIQGGAHSNSCQIGPSRLAPKGDPVEVSPPPWPSPTRMGTFHLSQFVINLHNLSMKTDPCEGSKS